MRRTPWASATGPTSTSTRSASSTCARPSRRRPATPEKLKRRARPAGAAPARHAGGASITPTTRRRERRSCITNPLFVRSHDFVGMQGSDRTRGAPPRCLAPAGRRTPAAGWWDRSPRCPMRWPRPNRTSWSRRRPRRLIWGDLVPQMILSAKIPRWWNVTPAQVHWVGLHLRYGRELLAEAALDPALRDAGGGGAWAACRAGADRRRSAGCSSAGEVKDALEQVTPSELFSIARDLAPEAQRRIRPACWRSCASWADAAQGHQLRGHFASLRHAQADAGEFLRAGAAQPAHLPHPDGLFQPDHGRELGIEHAVLGGAGGRNQRVARRSSTCGFRNGRRNWWSRFSPRTWRTGPLC